MLGRGRRLRYIEAEVGSERFIENGVVPSDDAIVDSTWAHPSKSDGRTAGFRTVCLYETLRLGSDSGLNELLQLCRTGPSTPFARALDGLAAASTLNPIKALTET